MLKGRPLSAKKKGNEKMSPKELMYVQDALGHEEQMKKSFCDFSSQLQDPDLKNLASQLCQKHTALFDSFYSLL